MSPPNERPWLADAVALLATGFCVIHCTLLPLAAAASPLLAVVSDAPWVHGLLLLAVVPFGLWAFWRGFALHRRAWVPVVGGLGLASVVAASACGLAGLEAAETGLAVGGAAALLPAHWINWRSAVGAHPLGRHDAISLRPSPGSSLPPRS